MGKISGGHCVGPMVAHSAGDSESVVEKCQQNFRINLRMKHPQSCPDILVATGSMHNKGERFHELKLILQKQFIGGRGQTVVCHGHAFRFVLLCILLGSYIIPIHMKPVEKVYSPDDNVSVAKVIVRVEIPQVHLSEES